MKKYRLAAIIVGSENGVLLVLREGSKYSNSAASHELRHELCSRGYGAKMVGKKSFGATSHI